MAKQKPNYYEILEIDNNADMDTIRNAYRNLAKMYHPDTCDIMSEKDAEEMFKLINEAYKVLSDPSKKEKYDKTFFSKPKQSNVSFSPSVSRSSNMPRNNTNQSYSYFDSINSQRKFYYGPDETILKLQKFKFILQIGFVLGALLLLILSGIFIDKFFKEGPKEDSGRNSSISMHKNIKKKDYFTLGSSKNRVEEVMGKPIKIGSYAYEYGNSSVFFDKNDRVIGWNNINDKLKVFLANANPNAEQIKINSTKKEVLSKLGTPIYIYKNTWKYEKLAIQFNSDEIVTGWKNIDNNIVNGQ